MADRVLSPVDFIQSRGGEIFWNDEEDVEQPRFVVLEGSKFDSSAIELLNRFKSLRALSCRDTTIRSDGIAQLSPRLGLEEITLEGVNIDDAFLRALPSCDGLEQFDVNSPRITDEGVASLSRFRKLRVLHVRGKQIQGRFLASFKGHRLSRVWLMSTSTDDAALEQLGKHESLTDLLLGDTPVTDAGLESLSALSNLKYLRLNNSRVEGPGLRHLAKCEKLETIDLESTNVRLEDVLALESLPRLTEVHLANTRVSRSDAGWFSVRLPAREARDEVIHLERLGGHYSVDLTNRTLEVRCRNVQLTDDEVARIQGLLSCATAIDLSGSGIGDSAVEQLGKCADRCHTLRLAHTCITPACAVHIAKLSNLRELDVSECCVNDDWLWAVGKCRGIRRLHLPGTQVSDAGVVVLRDLGELEFVDIRRARVTEDGVASLRANNSRITIRSNDK